MLKDRSRFCLFNSFWHHIENIVHYRSAKLEIEVRLDSLFRDRLCYTFRVATFELSSEQVSKPALEKRRHASHEENPRSPSRSPNTAARAFADRASVESIVNNVLEILAHSNLLHQLVLVSVHSSQLPEMTEDVVKTISELEGVEVSKSILHVRVSHDLHHSEDFSAEMESVSETRLLSLLRRQRFHRLQVEVVIEMQIVQVFAVNQQVEHIVTLAADLESCFDPIELRRLEEFRRFERSEQVAFSLRLWRSSF